MEHAKKMVLVDPRVLEQLKDKESFEHEKQLDKKHSRSVDKKVTSATNLELENILSDNTISDDQKMKRYGLNRYLMRGYKSRNALVCSGTRKTV